MTSRTSSSHAASLARARDQLRRLATGEQEWLALAPFRLVHENDLRGGRYTVRAAVVRPAPPEVVELAAGVVLALRTALDELASGLAGAPIRFPIHDSLAAFAQRARKPIARMSDEAQATLESLQPYHAIGGFRNGPLWTLLQLSDVAAVRLAAGALRAGAELGVNTQRDVAFVGAPAVVTGAFDDGAVVASASTKVTGRDPKLDMFLRAEFALAFAREGPARGREVVALLTELCDYVERTVFAALEPSLSPR